MLLFSERSVWTMIHGIGLGGAALLGLAAALFYLSATRPAMSAADADAPPAFAWLTVATAVVLWLAVIVGTYVVFPPYRATPPEGVTDLSAFPRALVLGSTDTAWLHGFGMEIKEHMPWVAAMLATAAAFVAVRYPAAMSQRPLRRMVGVLLAWAFAIVAFVSLLGVFVNKVAPLE